MSRQSWLRRRRGPPTLAQYFVAVMSHQQERNQFVESWLEERVGRIDLCSEMYCFSDFSNYYDVELGAPVWKYLVSCQPPRSVEDLVEVKLLAEQLQSELLQGESRQVNVDPGYLTSWQVVLSTVKNHAHRIYLSQGIYAEVTLRYQKGGFQPLPWTYPDYRSPLVLDFFLKVRELYRGSSLSF